MRTPTAPPVVITRCGNFYGGGDLNWNRIIPGTIRSLLRDERPVIRSDGQFVRDYFYVEDGAAAYMHLAEQLGGPPGRITRAGIQLFQREPGDGVANRRRVSHVMGSHAGAEVRNEANHEIRKQFLSAAKARTVLNWRPLFSLERRA